MSSARTVVLHCFGLRSRLYFLHPPDLPLHGWVRYWPMGLLPGPLTRYVKLRIAHALEMPEMFSSNRQLAISTCITARASRTCRDACRDRLPVVVDKCSQHSRRMRTRNFTYLARGPRNETAISAMYSFIG